MGSIDYYSFVSRLWFLFVRIVCGIVQASAFLSLNSPAGDEICCVNHIAELADVSCGLDALEEFLCLLVKHVETSPCSLQTEVGAHYAHIVRHYLAYLLHALRDEHLLLIGHGTFVVPLRHESVEVILINMLQGVTCSGVGIYHSLNERVAGKTVSAMETCA